MQFHVSLLSLRDTTSYNVSDPKFYFCIPVKSEKNMIMQKNKNYFYYIYNYILKAMYCDYVSS